MRRYLCCSDPSQEIQVSSIGCRLGNILSTSWLAITDWDMEFSITVETVELLTPSSVEFLEDDEPSFSYSWKTVSLAVSFIRANELITSDIRFKLLALRKLNLGRSRHSWSLFSRHSFCFMSRILFSRWCCHPYFYWLYPTVDWHPLVNKVMRCTSFIRWTVKSE